MTNKSDLQEPECISFRLLLCSEGRNQALSYICEANVRPGNLRSRLQKVSPERNMSCIYDAGYSPEYCEAIIIQGVPEEKIMSAKHG